MRPHGLRASEATGNRTRASEATGNRTRASEATGNRTGRERRRREIGLLGAVLVGVLVALQARVNGELGARLGDGVAAALISFGTGLMLLCVVVALVPRLRAGLRAVPDGLRSGRLVWWQCAGGACGAFLVACQGLTVATIGVAVFTVAVVAGQLSGSLWVDRAGIGPAGSTPVTVRRLGAVAVAIGAVAVAGAGSFATGSWWLAVLPALAGTGLAWQQAVNGQVATVGGPVTASWVNFAVGTAVLVAVAAVVYRRPWRARAAAARTVALRRGTAGCGAYRRRRAGGALDRGVAAGAGVGRRATGGGAGARCRSAVGAGCHSCGGRRVCD